MNYANVVIQIYHEFVQLEIATAKKILKIDGDIVVITNRDFWELYFGKMKSRTDFGMTDTDRKYVFINTRKNYPLKELQDTIWHEMIHIKFPEKNENWVKKKTREYVS